MLRVTRHWLTARATDAAMAVAPQLSAPAIDRIAPLITRCGPLCPVVARNVADNMRAVGVYSVAAHRAYFAQLGAHFAGALHALRYAGANAASGMHPELAELVRQRIELDASFDRLRAAADQGDGAIIMGPHIANYLLNLARLNQEIPLTIYLRYSKEARRRAAKERWYRATGVGWISEPPDAGGSLGRLGRMAAALRTGKVLFITPDLPQKRADGTPVRLFDREIYLPAGPAVLALRCGAPLFMLTAQVTAQRQRLVLRGPLSVSRQSGGRRAGVRAALQWFADEFEQFVRQRPALWYLWGDKRWTRVFRGDPRYVRNLDDSCALPAGAV